MGKEEGFEFDLKRAVTAMFKKWYILAIVSLLCAAVAFAYTKYWVAPTYTAREKVMITNASDKYEPSGILNYQDFTTSTSLVNTYISILTDHTTLQKVKELSGLNFSDRQLKNSIEGEQVGESFLMEISVTTTDPEISLKLMKAVLETIQNYQFISSSSQWIGGEFDEHGKVNVINPTHVERNSSGALRNTVLAFFVGFLVAAVFIVVADLMGDTITSDQWVKDNLTEYGPLLAVIPDIQDKKIKNLPRKDGYYRSAFHEISDTARGKDGNNK